MKGKSCFEIVPAPPKYGHKGKSKDKSYIFQVEKEHDREKWVEALRRATIRRTAAASFEVGAGESLPGEGGGVDVIQQPSASPMHKEGAGSSPRSPSAAGSVSEDDEDGDVSKVRTLSSASFRSSSATASDKEGYLMKKSPALLKGWQKRYFATNGTTGDIDYYKTVSGIDVIAFKNQCPCMFLLLFYNISATLFSFSLLGKRREQRQGGAPGHDQAERHQAGLRPGS